MTAVLRSLPQAADEFAEAVRWYEHCRAGLGGEFFDAVAAMTEVITTNPEIGTAVGPDSHTRRVLVPRFPYQIVYHLRPSDMVVVAIAHLKRHPEYWKTRR